MYIEKKARLYPARGIYEVYELYAKLNRTTHILLYQKEYTAGKWSRNIKIMPKMYQLPSYFYLATLGLRKNLEMKETVQNLRLAITYFQL